MIDWIPVSERLPEYKTKCLLFVSQYHHKKTIEFICTGYRAFTNVNGENWASFEGHTLLTTDVIHWMPLPPPPNEK